MLVDIFSTIPVSVEIWAYGSRVNGDAHEGSDLDLVIRNTSDVEFPVAVFFQLKESIRESNVPFLVDLFLWNQLPEGFKKNIEQKHEVLFKKIT